MLLGYNILAVGFCLKKAIKGMEKQTMNALKLICFPVNQSRTNFKIGL